LSKDSENHWWKKIIEDPEERHSKGGETCTGFRAGFADKWDQMSKEDEGVAGI